MVFDSSIEALNLCTKISSKAFDSKMPNLKELIVEYRAGVTNRCRNGSNIMKYWVEVTKKLHDKRPRIHLFELVPTDLSGKTLDIDSVCCSVRKHFKVIFA